MSEDPDFKARSAKFLEQLQERENEKAFLYDKTIGGHRAPRPSADYIEKCVGPLKSADELELEAHEAAINEREEMRRATLRRQEVEQSMRKNNRNVEATKGQKIKH